MKTPCEITVWYVLPTIRREIAKELVFEHKYTQAKVARCFGVTDAAISQYLNKKRGANLEYGDLEEEKAFMEQISKSAAMIASGESDISNETCRLCKYIKSVGVLARVYKMNTGDEPPACACKD